MKKWVRRMSVLAASLTMTGGAVTTPATAADVLAWECPQETSCYYDGRDGINRIYIAPSAGCHVLPTTVANRITSVRNIGFGTVHLYDRSPCAGELLISIPEDRLVSLSGADDNRANSIRVDP